PNRTLFPYPTLFRSTENDTKEMLPRSSVDEVMSQVLADVSQAIEFFPEGASEKSRASKAAAYALKADVLLWKAKVLKGSSAELEESEEHTSELQSRE